MRYCEDLDTMEQVLQAFDTVLVSMSYQRDDIDMLDTLEILRVKVARNIGPTMDSKLIKYHENDDAQLLYGFLVLTLGDYGVAPRSGWIMDCHIEAVLSHVYDLIKAKKLQVKTIKAMEKEGVEID